MNKIKFAMLISFITDFGQHRMTDVQIEQVDDLTQPEPVDHSKAEFDSASFQAMMTAMANGKIIDAIKVHRSITGYGLRESKDAVEAAMRGSIVREQNLNSR